MMNMSYEHVALVILLVTFGGAVLGLLVGPMLHTLDDDEDWY